jgi:ATP-dependent Clp protease ATP-binding subunit ClpC
VLALLQDEAIRFNHNYIGLEHLLLGLVREGESVAARAFDALGADLSKLRTFVEFNVGRGAGAAPSEIVLAPQVKAVIDRAGKEATLLGDSMTGPEHLALALVLSGDRIALEALRSIGVTAEAVRHQVTATRAAGPPPPPAERARQRLSGRAELPGLKMDSPAVLKTGVGVRLLSLIPSQRVSVARDGSINYVLRAEDEFIFVVVDEFGNEQIGTHGRVSYAQIERID